MNKSCLRWLFGIAITISVTINVLCAESSAGHFQSNNATLTFTGIWALQTGNGGYVSIGLRNTGDKPIKAFRAKILKTNDFNENKDIATIEATSETRYQATRMDKSESHHIIQAGELCYYNIITANSETIIYLSPESLVRSRILSGHNNPKDSQEADEATQGSGRFILQVSNLTNADDEDLNRMASSPKTTQSSDPGANVEQKTEDKVDQPAAPSETTDTRKYSQSDTVIGIAPNDYLNVHSAPSMSATTTFKLSNGQRVLVTGSSEFNGDSEWIPITFGSHQGWVRNKYLQPEAPAISDNTKLLKADDISTWNVVRVQMAIDEIYAHHGTEFPNKKVQAWADQQPWYHRIADMTPEKAESLFAPTEKANVEILSARRDMIAGD